MRPLRLHFAVCVSLLALLCGGSHAASTARLLQQQADTTNNAVVATVDITAGPTITPTTTANGTVVFTDDSGEVWQVLNTTDPTTAPVAPPTPTPSSTPVNNTRPAHLDLKEQANQNEAPAANGQATATHHKTPVVGFVIVGAMAIVCVGIAAGVTKRKQAAAGGEDHH